MESGLQPNQDVSAHSIILDFPAIEAMQEASEAVGWECEYRLFSPPVDWRREQSCANSAMPLFFAKQPIVD